VRLVESNLSMHNAMVEKKLNNSLSASYFDCIVKEKRQGSRRPFSLGDTNRRWFAIEDLKGHGKDEIAKKKELALCYYKNPTSSDQCGWIFLSDVESVEQNIVQRWITISHPSRTYRLQASDHVQHARWYTVLSKHCGAPSQEHLTNINESSPKQPMAENQKSKVKPTKDNRNDKHQASAELNFLRQLNGKECNSSSVEELKCDKAPPAKDQDQRERNQSYDREDNSNKHNWIDNSEDRMIPEKPRAHLQDVSNEIRSESKLSTKYDLNKKANVPYQQKPHLPNNSSYDHRMAPKPQEGEGDSSTNMRLIRAIQSSRGSAENHYLNLTHSADPDTTNDFSYSAHGEREEGKREMFFSLAHPDGSGCCSGEVGGKYSEFDTKGAQHSSQTVSNEGSGLQTHSQCFHRDRVFEGTKQVEQNESTEVQEFSLESDSDNEKDDDTAYGRSLQLSSNTSNQRSGSNDEDTKHLSGWNAQLVSSNTNNRNNQYGVDNESGDVGLTPDKNFITECWDDSSSPEKSPTKHKTDENDTIVLRDLVKPNPTCRPNSQPDARSNYSNFHCTVQPDEDFVNEDWDA